jgi:hypothetical protein
MGSKTIIGEENIRKTIENIPKESFTVLGFIKTPRRLYPEDWKGLTKRFGLFGGKRRYTFSTYFSNRLDVYSHKACSILAPFTRYSEGRFENYRRTTDEERKVLEAP